MIKEKDKGKHKYKDKDKDNGIICGAGGWKVSQHLNPSWILANSVIMDVSGIPFLVRMMKRRSSMVPGASSEDGGGLLMPEGSSQSGTPDSWSRRSSLWLEEVIRVPNHLWLYINFACFNSSFDGGGGRKRGDDWGGGSQAYHRRRDQVRGYKVKVDTKWKWIESESGWKLKVGRKYKWKGKWKCIESESV